MMTLQDVKNAVDQLTEAERAELRAYLESAPRTDDILSPEERAKRLDAAFNQLSEGLTEEELAEMTAAMNKDYIEDVDLDQWKD